MVRKQRMIAHWRNKITGVERFCEAGSTTDIHLSCSPDIMERLGVAPQGKPLPPKQPKARKPVKETPEKKG